MTKKPGNHRRRTAIFLFVAVLLLSGGLFLFGRLGLFDVIKGLHLGRGVGAPEWQRGMAYVSWDKDEFATLSSDRSLEAMRDIGVDWVAITPSFYQGDCSSTEICPVESTPSDSSIVHVIKKAHSLGIKVMLKPHLEVEDTSSGKWRGDIEFLEEKDWQDWFDSYNEFILHYAKIAEENRVEMFCVGTELTDSAILKPDMWREKVIAPVRRVYNGPLTYAANWRREFKNIRFWDALDYAGIDAYFPLVDDILSPDTERIRDGWARWIGEIDAWQARIDKPVIFPEVGYHSAAWAARRPWEHMAQGMVDVELQKNLYKVLLEEFSKKDYFYGAYWWLWEPDPGSGGEKDRGFTPQNKPAEDILREWYAKPSPRKSSDKK
ncbi:MAG: hypothetical protein HQ593_01790 [Candidatus Omnitrophica bacterium]|nr:hypothetical protein [Candidatus Omnitrophota bacterium]